MKPGETVADSAGRVIRRELQLNLDKDELNKRIKTVNHYTFVWEKRNQPPQDNGTADVSLVLSFTLKKDEISTIVMDQQEYSAFQWIEPEIVAGTKIATRI